MNTKDYIVPQYATKFENLSKFPTPSVVPLLHPKYKNEQTMTITHQTLVTSEVKVIYFHTNLKL